MFKIIKLCVLVFGFVLPVLALTGCATITSGTNQSIIIVTEKDVQGADCKLTDKKGGTWYLPNSPGVVMVRKGDGPMTIICNKKGFKPSQLVVDETITGATFGNIILGGLVGFGVDAVSGAAQQYPDKVIVWMEPEESDSEEKKTAFMQETEEFLDKEKVPQNHSGDMQKKEKPIKQNSQLIATNWQPATGKTPPTLYDAKTGLKWVIITSNPVDLTTAINTCKSLAPEDNKVSRVPTLREFEQLWKKYKNDENIRIFNKKEYTTSDKDNFTGHGYSKTFSFATGSSGNLYAAHLACVNNQVMVSSSQ